MRRLISFSRFLPALGVTLVARALAFPALADTITFATAPLGPSFTGPVTESGFTYSTLSGNLYVNQFGNPGQDMEGTEGSGGGVLEIVEGGGEFNLESLDFAAYASSGAGSQTLEVEGFLGGSLVGVDQYPLSNTKNYDPSYPNWTTEDASVLAGKNIDELEIVLNAGLRPDFFTEAIDNVVLTAPG